MKSLLVCNTRFSKPICPVSRSQNPVLLSSYHNVPPNLTDHRIFNQIYMTDAMLMGHDLFILPEHMSSAPVCFVGFVLLNLFCFLCSESSSVSLSFFFDFCIVCYWLYGVWLLFWYLPIFLISGGCVDQSFVLRVLFRRSLFVSLFLFPFVFVIVSSVLLGLTSTDYLFVFSNFA